MYRMLIAAAVACTVATAAGSAQAGWNDYSDGSYAQPCGCQDYGYDQSGDWSDGYQDNYGYEGDYDVPFLPSESYGYSGYGPSYQSRSYDYSNYGYDRDYSRSYYAAPGYGRYTNSYDDDHRYQPRRYSYRRSYHYTAPHYRTYRTRPRHDYGHSSYDGERG